MRAAPIAFALVVATIAACGGEEKSPAADPAPAEPTERADESPAANAEEPPAENLELPAAPTDHERTSSEDREVLADLYVRFASDPDEFVAAVEEIPSSVRVQIYGYLLCAAPKLKAAAAALGRPGAPATVTLPPEAEELIGFSGSPKRAKQSFLKQLAGEFLVVGRAIQSLDRGKTEHVEAILARQKRNLQMMKAMHGPEKSAAWAKRIQRVFPEIFAVLAPDC